MPTTTAEDKQVSTHQEHRFIKPAVASEDKGKKATI